MAEVGATASLSARVGMSHKKGWGSHDGMTPHHSITIKREVSNDSSDDDLVGEADKLWHLARKLCEQKMSDDIKDLKKAD